MAIKLLDLPPFCLDRILMNLSIKDLVNAANANEILACSAVRVFNLNFKNEHIVFGLLGNPNSINDQTSILSILDHFGGQIKKLISRIKNQFILDKIVDICHLNLHEWYLDIQHEGVNMNINMNINCQFPNLKKLSLVFYFDESFIDRIPNLETIDVCNWSLPFAEKDLEFTRNVAHFVNNNKQISNLFIAHEAPAINHLKLLINWDALMVEKLVIFTNHQPDLEGIRFGSNLRSLMLSAGSFNNFKSFDLLNIKELEIRSFSDPKTAGFSCFQQNSNLKKLRIRLILRSLNAIDKCSEMLQLLANNLLKIEEVHIDVSIFNPIPISIETKMFAIGKNFLRRSSSDVLKMMKVAIVSIRHRQDEPTLIPITRNSIGDWDSIIERTYIKYKEYVTISFNKRNI